MPRSFESVDAKANSVKHNLHHGSEFGAPRNDENELYKYWLQNTGYTDDKRGFYTLAEAEEYIDCLKSLR